MQNFQDSIFIWTLRCRQIFKSALVYLKQFHFRNFRNFLIYYNLFRCDNAVKENDFIYHMAVPELSSLKEIEGVTLVKPIPISFDDENKAADIFKRLIPMKAHESASLYRYTLLLQYFFV